MIDQDGVVLGRDYKVTKDISTIIQKYSSPEFLLVPNSDTPIKRLSNNFEALLGLKPTILIGEKGAVVFYDSKTFFTSNIQGIDKYRTSLVKVFRQTDCLIEIGDSATWIREQKRFKPNTKVLIIDSFRQQTIGFYMLKTNNSGIAMIDNDWYREGLNIVDTLSLPKGLIDNDRNEKYGIVIMNVNSVDKTTGYLFLQKYYPSAKFFMIGDSDSDIINNASVIHCAVANATDNLKSTSCFVSKGQVTHGLEECIEWIWKY